MNTPIWDELIRLYTKIGEVDPERSVSEDLVYYLRNGQVVSTPGHLIMGQRIADGWFIHVAVGTNGIKKFCDLMPYYLPWIGWAREAKCRKTVKWFITDNILRRFGYDSNEFKNRKPAPL